MSEPHGAPNGAGIDEKTPISFIVMLVLAVLYLGWRLVEGVIWLVRWLG